MTREVGPETVVMQDRLAYAPWLHPVGRRLPGTQALAWRDWLVWDRASAAQIRLKLGLLRARGAEVLQLVPDAGQAEQAAALEALETVRAWLSQYRPGAVGVPALSLSSSTPASASDCLRALAALVPEDMCLLLPDSSGAWRLQAALLGFPASWRLADKIGRPMSAIHDSVGSYTAGMDARVGRMFELLSPDRPVWRANALLYAHPDLFQPHRVETEAPRGQFLRSERQSLIKLPRSGAVLFSIHTTVIPEAALTERQRAGLRAHPVEHAGGG